MAGEVRAALGAQQGRPDGLKFVAVAALLGIRAILIINCLMQW